jgi:hypothetical protein
MNFGSSGIASGMPNRGSSTVASLAFSSPPVRDAAWTPLTRQDDRTRGARRGPAQSYEFCGSRTGG